VSAPLLPNGPAQAGRGNDDQLQTKTPSRPCLQPDGWAPFYYRTSYHLSRSSNHVTYHTPPKTANEIKRYANEILRRRRRQTAKQIIAARSIAMTGPKNKRYTLQKTVMPRGTSRKAPRNKATANQVRIRTDKMGRLLWGFAIRSVDVLIWPNESHHWRRASDVRYETAAQSRRPVHVLVRLAESVQASFRPA
jgi:hypothetical protein